MIERFRVRIPAGAAGEFSSPDLTFCADSYLVSVQLAMLPQWHIKDAGYSAKIASDRFDLNTHTPLNLRGRSGLTAAVQALLGNLSLYGLTRNSSGNTRPQSSQLLA